MRSLANLAGRFVMPGGVEVNRGLGHKCDEQNRKAKDNQPGSVTSHNEPFRHRLVSYIESRAAAKMCAPVSSAWHEATMFAS
jgi:hypothetical protein